MMMKKTSILSFLLILGLSLTGCRLEEPCAEAGRTLLVYIAADNNLNDFSYSNIRSMVAGAGGNALNNGNLLVYHDSRNEAPRLIHIRKGPDGTMVEEVIRTYEYRNSVSVEVMRSVLDEVFLCEAYKAESYALLLWSHGTAWLPANLKSYLRSYGQDGDNFMEIYELNEALEGYKFDYIIFDDCYMANIEVAYALRNRTDYILASPTEVLADGLPYSRIMPYLFSNQSVPDALKNVGETFYTYYNEQSGDWQSATIALVATQALEALANVCREILQGQEERIMELPLEEIQLIERLGLAYHALYDFGDFVKQLATPNQYSRFEDALRNVVLYKASTDKAYYMAEQQSFPIDKERFCGISTYIPQEALFKLNEWYKRLDWYKAVYE